MSSPDDPTRPHGPVPDPPPARGDEATRVREGAVPAGAAPSHRIGRYRLIEVIGRGGMGIVYRAHQERPARDVALKLISGYADDARLRRMEFEAETLGRLHHPGIAQIHEAGVHEHDGQRMPFFAMELVEGEELLDFVRGAGHPDGDGLGMRARLELFARICHAVEHAHQQGVIHRDLKPANILVTRDGQPKILDFGIARAVEDQRSTIDRTTTGAVLGTLPFMSPEQFAGDASRVDTRTDVYALGVVLYQLLVGQHPHAIEDTEMAAVIDIVRRGEPRRLTALAPERASELAGDVETIALKALEKDPDRRYSSASELAEDVRRHLASEPITARPPSALYQLRKFAVRNRAMVTGAAVALLALVAGTAVATVMAVRATHARDEAALARDEATEARDRADAARARVEELLELERDAREAAQAATAEAVREREAATAVLDFLIDDVLAEARPTRRGNAVTVAEAVRAAARRVGDGRFATRPEAEVAVRDAIAATLVELGDGRAALDTLERARALVEELGLEDRLVGYDVRRTLGLALILLGRHEDADSVLSGLLTELVRRFGEEHDGTQATRANLVALYRDTGRYADAVATAEPLVRVRTALFGSDDPRTLRSRGSVLGARIAAGDTVGLEAPLRELLDVQRRVLGPGAEPTVNALGDLAQLLLHEGRFEDAVAVSEELLPLERELFGELHPRAIVRESVLGDLLVRAGRADESWPLLDGAVETLSATLGPDDPFTIDVANRRLIALMNTGRFADALEPARELFERSRVTSGLRHPDTLNALAVLAGAEAQAGDPEAAVDLGREVVLLRTELLGATHSATLHSRLMLGDALFFADRREEGLAEVLATLDLLEHSPDHIQLANGVAILESLLAGSEDLPEHARAEARAAELAARVAELPSPR